MPLSPAFASLQVPGWTPAGVGARGEGADACGARRRALIAAAEGDTAARVSLIEALTDHVSALRAAAAPALPGLAAWLGVEPGEVAASPFGLRACALGVAAGARLRHVERAPVWRWRRELLPDSPEGAVVRDDDAADLRGADVRGARRVADLRGARRFADGDGDGGSDLREAGLRGGVLRGARRLADAAGGADPFGVTRLTAGPPEADDVAALAGRDVLDPDHGAWRDQALQLGRYQGFLLDAPHAGFNPYHSARWTPHELLHRAVGFAHRRRAGRLWIAIGARLAELLPVVHWYGPDQLARLDGAPFERLADAAAPRAELARARWWHGDAHELRTLIAAGIDALGRGAAALEEELAACRRAMATGAWPAAGPRLRALDPALDPRSDAQAYAAGHCQRLRDPRVDAALRGFAPLGVARFDDLRAFTVAIEERFDALIFGPIALDPPAIAARAAGRDAWEAALAAAVCGDDQRPAARGRLDPAVAPVKEGLRALAPAVECWLGLHGLRDGVVAGLVDGGRGPLLARLEAVLARGLSAAAGTPAANRGWHVALALCRWQLCLAGATARDDAAECLGEAPLDDDWLFDDEDGEDEGESAAADGRGDALDDSLVPSTAFSVHIAELDVLGLHEALLAGERADAALAAAETAGESAWLVGDRGGAVVVVPCPPAVARAFAALQARAATAGGGPRATEVLAAFVAALLPRPSGRSSRVRGRAAAEGAAEAWIDALREAGALALLRLR